ncbi:MAG TPA: hypothetical protein ACFYDZ_03430 [Candidatus Brocadiaceae bacterium]
MFAQKPEGGKAERGTSSLSIRAVGQAVQNNHDLSAGQAGVQIAESNAITASICSCSVFNPVDISLYPPVTKHNKHKVVNPSYIALEQEVDALAERAGKSRFPATTTDCNCLTNISDAQTKLNLSLSLPVSPHYKPKQTLRWHMII